MKNQRPPGPAPEHEASPLGAVLLNRHSLGKSAPHPPQENCIIFSLSTENKPK